MTSNRDKILSLYKKMSTNSERQWFSIADDKAKEIRILDILLDHSVGSHWGILKGKEGKAGGTIRCPAVWSEGADPCPACELVSEYANSGDKEKADKLAARKRAAMVVLDLSEEKPVPKLWEAPISVFKIIKGMYAKGIYGDIMSLKEGRNLYVSRTKNNGKVEYEVLPGANASALDFDLSKIPNLEKDLKPPTYDEILYAIEYGEFPKKEGDKGVDDDDGDDEVEQKFQSSRKPSSYSKGLPATKTREEPSEIERLAEESIAEPEERSAKSMLQERIAKMRKNK